MRFTTTKKIRSTKSTPIEYVVDEHFFLYSINGIITVYNGIRKVTINPGESCLGSKSHPVRFIKKPINNKTETIFIKLHEDFLRSIQKRYQIERNANGHIGTIVPVNKSGILDGYINSLSPYCNEKGQFNSTFLDVKREELLLILLENQPSLSDILFNFEIPPKTDLMVFMNQNFHLNVSVEQFAYLTGRSLSSFKREFQKIFNAPPRQWLTNKRLDEAYFLIQTQQCKPASFYLRIGFEDLSHVSFAFKERFGISPKQLLRNGSGTE